MKMHSYECLHKIVIFSANGTVFIIYSLRHFAITVTVLKLILMFFYRSLDIEEEISQCLTSRNTM